MTYKMKPIDFKGKPYIEVHERIKYFKSEHPNGAIMTELLSNEGGICIFKATVSIDDKIVSTGHAYEVEGSSFINKTSYIENCETSSVGRALGIFGIGIDAGIASAEEVKNAESNQKLKLMTQKQSDKLIDFCKREKLDAKEMAKDFGITKKMRAVQFDNSFRQLEKAVSSGDIGFRFAVPEGDDELL